MPEWAFKKVRSELLELNGLTDFLFHSAKLCGARAQCLSQAETQGHRLHLIRFGP